jgi:hypothetical protein
LFAREAVRAASVDHGTTRTLVRDAQWDSQSKTNGDPESLVVKPETTGCDRKSVEPLTAMGG